MICVDYNYKTHAYDEKLEDYEKEISKVDDKLLKAKKDKDIIQLNRAKSELTGIKKAYEVASAYNSKDISNDNKTSNYGFNLINLNNSYHKIIDVGKKHVGASRYVWGGGRNDYDVLRGRFDCSSFVHWAYGEVGINLGARTSVTTDTLKYKGYKVSLSDIKVGDMVFFDTYKKDGHVGIYAGNGKFLGAQSSTGVAFAKMDTGYWSGKFTGHVRRLID